MRVLERRLRRLDEGLLPPAQTEASRLYYEAMLEISRNRAYRLGLPEPDSVPGLEWTRHMTSHAEIILTAQGRLRREPEKPA